MHNTNVNTVTTSPVPLDKVTVTGGFWKSRMDMVVRDLIPYQWSALNDEIDGAEPSHAIENFRIAAGESAGKFQGFIFQDSDVAKWIEAASYTLYYKPDPALQARIDEAVRLIAKAQQPDGYLNTYFTVAAPEKRWKDLVMGHEMYCAGHMIEAAVAYFQASGKRQLLDVVCRYADHIALVFGPGKSQNHGFCGHPEIELALYRLAALTGEDKYRDLADHFVDVRGTIPDFHNVEAAMKGMIGNTKWFQDDYYLAHKPVRDQHSAEGHSVRAMYLYTAMADYYLHSRDPALLDALRDLWDSTTKKRMYLTAGLGSQYDGERFTVDYDLPPDAAYAETCASIGLVFWAWRMLQIDPDARYAEVIERAIYNGALSGLSLDGTRYFYVNPLEVSPSAANYRHDHQHVKTSRVPWFGCSCCPPNIARMIASVGQYVVSHSEDALWLHQYIDGTFEIAGLGMVIRQETQLPWEGRVELRIQTAAVTSAAGGLELNFRVPAWAGKFSVFVNGKLLDNPVARKGYAAIRRTWQNGDTVRIEFDMPVRFIHSHPAVAETAGKVAIQRGPLVYCAEEIDNGAELYNLSVDTKAATSAAFDPALMDGTMVVSVAGFRTQAPEGDYLYSDGDLSDFIREQTLKLVPYHRWGNRAPGQEMRVWLNRRG